MKVGRNDPCPCGSGKKYKQCCLGKEEEAGRLMHQIRQERPPNIFEHNLSEMVFEDWHYESEEAQDAWEDDEDWEEEDWDEVEADDEWEREARLADEEIEPDDFEEPEEGENQIVSPEEEAEWQQFLAADLNGKITHFESVMASTEAMEAEDALHYLEEIFETAYKENARERYDPVIEKFHRRHPQAYHECAFAYLNNRIHNALVLGNDAALEPLVNELAVTDTYIFKEVRYALAYYGKLKEINAAMPLICPRPDEPEQERLWDHHEASQAVRHLAFAWLERAGAPGLDDLAWYEPFTRFSKIPAARLAEFMALLSGKEQRRWAPEDFQVPKKARPPGARTVAQNLFDLLLQFQGHVRRTRAVPFCKAELACEQLLNYFMRRACGELFPMLELQKNPAAFSQLRQQMHLDWPAHVRLLCPDRLTLSHYVQRVLALNFSDAYLRAALFELLPEWLDFLVTRQLLEPAQRTQARGELAELYETVLAKLRDFEHDPNLYKNLSNSAWRVAPAERA